MEEAGLKESEDWLTFSQKVISDDEGSDGEEKNKAERSREESMNLELVELTSKQDGQTRQQCEFELDGSKRDRHSPHANKANKLARKHEIGTC